MSYGLCGDGCGKARISREICAGRELVFFSSVGVGRIEKGKFKTEGSGREWSSIVVYILDMRELKKLLNRYFAPHISIMPAELQRALTIVGALKIDFRIVVTGF